MDIMSVIKDLFDLAPDNFMDCVKMEWKFLELSHNWLQFLNSKDISSNFKDQSTVQTRAVAEATEIIRSDLSNAPCIKDLSKMVGLNQQYLKEAFKKINGITIHQFLIYERMKLAQSLIQHTETPVSEISKKVGYADPGHFSKLYRKFHGATPLNHRQQIVHR